MFGIIHYKVHVPLMFVYCQEKNNNKKHYDILNIQKRLETHVLKIHWEHMQNSLRTYFCLLGSRIVRKKFCFKNESFKL